MSGEASNATWLKRLHESLQPTVEPDYLAIDLYCGAGGFSLGFAASGFKVYGVDRDPDAVATYSENVGEAKCVDLGNEVSLPKADALIAGPPCQPWSRAGKQLRELDARNGFPVIAKAVDVIDPHVVVVENVPDISRDDHRKPLDDFLAFLAQRGYAVSEGVLNAANFQVPQNRRRAFVIGVLDAERIKLPEPGNSSCAVHDAISDTCHMAPEDARFLSEDMDRYIARYEQASCCRVPRDLHLHRPARTLTVRNLAGATGDMMRICMPDGRRRMLTVREAARLQSFPDWFHFHGSRSSQFSQIGNAVPPLLGLALAKQVRQRLHSLTTAKACA